MTGPTDTSRPASAAKEPAGELAAMTLNEAGYASLPPTGTYSPPESQQEYHEHSTPTIAPSFHPQYAVDNSAQYVYYTPTPQIIHPPLLPPFSPVGPDGMNMGYGFEPRMQPEPSSGVVGGALGIMQPGVAMAGEMAPPFTSLPEAFDPSPPGPIDRSQSASNMTDSWRKGVSGSGASIGGDTNRRGNAGVYQPPHIQRMIEQQHQQQQQQQQAQTALPTTMLHQLPLAGHTVDRMRMMVDPDVRSPPPYGFQTLAENQMEWWQAIPQQHMAAGSWTQGVAHAPMLGQQGVGNGSARRGAYGSQGRGGLGGGRGGFGSVWRGSDKRKEVSLPAQHNSSGSDGRVC